MVSTRPSASASCAPAFTAAVWTCQAKPIQNHHEFPEFDHRAAPSRQSKEHHKLPPVLPELVLGGWGIFKCYFGENYSAADTSLTETPQTRCGLRIRLDFCRKGRIAMCAGRLSCSPAGALRARPAICGALGRASVNSGAANQRSPNDVDPFHKIPEHEERRT
jgi:hypothetical protein